MTAMYEQAEKQISTLLEQVTDAYERLRIDEKNNELALLRAKSEQSDFWNDNQAAQETMKKLAKLEAATAPWVNLKKDSTDLRDLIALHDDSMAEELGLQLSTFTARFEELKRQLRFNGKYDDHDAILSIHAGAGGTDAQDWAGMLLRMYIRWAELHDMKTETIEQSAGDEAGIKSVTLSITGLNSYGKLKSEHGVHRLVRLSPFNADSLRQTSFAKVEVMPQIDQPDEIAIDEKELKVDVYRAGGHGGQSVNTTDSAVRITHIPTGIVVSIQNERSQLQNKETAMKVLRSRLAQLAIEQHQDRVSELKGPNQSAEWGNQIRSYVLHPYKQVKDLRTRYETGNPESVLDGELDAFINAYLEQNLES